MSTADDERLLDFLVRVSQDLSLLEVWQKRDAAAVLDEAGAKLSSYHREVLVKGDLKEIHIALEKEQAGDDVSAHQGRGIGPCWVLVKG